MNPITNQSLNACEFARRQRREALLNPIQTASQVQGNNTKEKILKASSIALAIIFSPLLVVLGSIIRTSQDIIFPNPYRIQWFKAKNASNYAAILRHATVIEGTKDGIKKHVDHKSIEKQVLNHSACFSVAKARLVLVGTLPYQLIKNGYLTGKHIYQNITK